MTEATRFLIGYEVGSGEPVEAVLHHLFISGVTQHSGKTTALEAFIERVQPRRTLVFRCGRGEIGFSGARRIPPYFRQRTDWQFVEGLLSAHLHEKLKFYRGDIIQACRGAKADAARERREATLQDVHRQIRKRLEKIRKDSFVEKVLIELDQYFSEVLPILDTIKFSAALELHDGMNMMDLEGVPLAIQHLVITACATKIMETESNTILIIPEARQMIPEDQRTIVKLAVEDITARGAKIGNYVWLDSQHMTGVDLDVLRNVDIRMYGRQTQDREVERVARAIPGRKVTRDNVQGLLIGQFYTVLYGKEIQKVYVRPAWLPERVARDVALGKATLEDALKFKEEDDVDDQEREKYEQNLKVRTAERDQMHKSLGEANRKWEGLQLELRHVRGEFERYKAAYGPEPGIQFKGPTHGDLPKFRPPLAPAPLAPEAIEVLKRGGAGGGPVPLAPIQHVPNIVDEADIRRIVRDELRQVAGFRILEVAPARAILKGFAADAVGRVRKELGALSARQKQMLAFLAAKGTAVRGVEVVVPLFGERTGALYEELQKLVPTGLVTYTPSSKNYQYAGRAFVKAAVGTPFDLSDQDVQEALLAIENEFAHLVARA